jgi:iron-sulfur cluster repair protein YtfE (RIC family)
MELHAFVAGILEEHHDPLWRRLTTLGPLAARVERERGDARALRLRWLVGDLGTLLVSHLHHEDRELLAIADGHPSDEAAARLRAEHDRIKDVLGRIRSEIGDADYAPAADAGPRERELCAELRELDRRLAQQMLLEELVMVA